MEIDMAPRMGIEDRLRPAERKYNNRVQTTVVGANRCRFRSRGELRLAQWLEAELQAGRIRDWAHEPERIDFQAELAAEAEKLAESWDTAQDACDLRAMTDRLAEIVRLLRCWRGPKVYVPDFVVTETDGRRRYVEFKGRMQSRDVTKLRRLREARPEAVIWLVLARRDRRNAKYVAQAAKYVDAIRVETKDGYESTDAVLPNPSCRGARRRHSGAS